MTKTAVNSPMKSWIRLLAECRGGGGVEVCAGGAGGAVDAGEGDGAG